MKSVTGPSSSCCKPAFASQSARRSREERLFLTKFEKSLGTRSIRTIVGKYLKEAGIAGASTHALPHTFATHHVRKGTKLDVVRQALGHESLATTSVYVGLAREVMDQELQRNAL
jgi:integrase/recombinase XerC